MSAPALRVRELHVAYGGGRPVLSGLELDAQAGECLAVVGESGCGKTTLVRTLLGLLPPGAKASGSAELNGTQLLGLRRRAFRQLLGTQIGYVAQDPYAACDPLRTVGHHVAEAWRAKGLRPPEGTIAAKLDQLGIVEGGRRARDHPHQWSGGMLQRATIAAATAHDPKLTIADEPTSALDADLADGVLDALRSAGRTLLLISHDLRLVERHADRVAVMRDGGIVESGPTADVLGAPQHPYTVGLLASSTAIRVRTAASPAAAVERQDPPATTQARTPVMTAVGLNRSYRTGRHTVSAVRDVSITISPGEIVGLSGSSGSGKSTLLRLLSGLEPADSGSVGFGPNGQAVPPPGYVMPIFQDPVASLDRRWPLWRSVTEPLTRRESLPRAERIDRARAALERVNLGHLDPGLLPGQLSVGQCQRVAIARAVIAGPALVVADEPTASLDVTTATEIVALLREVANEDTAILVVSHDLPLLGTLADRILRMDHGRLSEPAPTSTAAGS
jgi:peptide/nickel transport system ATP-binding protein